MKNILIAACLLFGPAFANENASGLYVIETPDAPKAIGPFSQAIRAGDYIFVSGQLPVDPQNGQLIRDDITQAVHQIFDNLEAILRAENLTLQDVVRAEVFLKDLSDFAAMNQVYAERMDGHKPARQTIQVAKLPLDAPVEISCIAYKKP